ncbi:alpha-keto acid decarboxylase family protein [Serratia plymuthica]|uniref:Indole-3-pyruvate decarboxylase n=1 Tax=Serratia plymuthica TaxID=82996 RepID=A0A2X4V0Q6_SERPL|nr:thiamine pyrophosphate-binding protein [Serratia plymuthica]QPS19779.1 indolepyruvate decarboxylase [Serratia plymuthica]QPS61491.1 indolepyruvate decarboxylase [Serratia plymuthica]RKS61433.1 indolepyruvate decarboxylase [Serratia plymuthica]CAI2466866.1 Indole-3-pyruvate decarboxylase [Serratia plymuthica]SQI44209.1 Indole-3-pyruvate decarboxylase [Serratia plymuthica]
MSKSYTVADYLLDRLAQIGIRHFFGVPGDYNLQFLDHVIAHPQIAWVGCANELNAAYAADGYARCKPAAALLTTFGVGELSAVNGIAGSYAEYLPVIHVVGTPALRAQRAGDLLHHSLGDGDFGHFARMAKEVTVAQANLTAANAEAEIDRLLTTALFERRPVYLMLPSDVAEAPLASRPAPLMLRQAHLSQASLQAFIAAAREMLLPARRVSLLADFLAERFGAEGVLEQWMNEVDMPHSTMLLGKSVFDETHACFTGTYAGAASDPQVKQLIENADVVITVGVRFTDTITAGFSHHLPTEKCIDIQPFEARVGQQVFSQIPIRDAVQALHQLTLPLALQWQLPAIKRPELPAPSGSGLDQHGFWQQIQDFLRPGDIVIADQGTACFGAAVLSLPQGCRFIVQSLWGSIGYTLPAAFGAQTAEPDRRVLLLIGDGAAQLTAQEIGSMLRDGLKPVIFLLNNEGYTVERAIHGPEQRYNDIAQWNWTQLPQALAGEHQVKTLRVTEPEQLRQALREVGDSRQLAFVEVVLPKMDIPELLDTVSRAIQSRNAAA